MKTLLIGANGQVGYELAARLAGADLLATTRSGVAPLDGVTCVALDVGDRGALRSLILDCRPDVVINASAYTAVDRAESESELAFRINAEAPAAMATACLEAGARLVHYSTDYVFDGTARSPYRTDSAVSPLGVYGRSKRAGEVAVLASGADVLVLRTAWVYGTRGQNFLRTMLRLGRERDELRVVDDQVGCPTPAWFVAAATAQLLERAAPAGIHHAVTRGQVSWFGFAEAIFVTALERGLIARAPTLVPIPSSAYPTPARRPDYSVLDSGGLAALGIDVPDWRDAFRHTLDRDGDALARLLG
ncbi:dTDP-4-dehydrorhamnose reductase [Cognatilysobacter lacus]|uniref:dTDP-4-dehydrorhamnose reductase n=1 Tax=Cognatilysobacter lacus TaxID=1643323 RepID=A0A5D8Z3S0_9GAMM|nr:dTDP-4-dehydrorhamnose reductase [Lysobacter lacus]TZF89186.1 dTDP-4-dehydrorhamnose reductase [Lysobacter lacus]